MATHTQKPATDNSKPYFSIVKCEIQTKEYELKNKECELRNEESEMKNVSAYGFTDYKTQKFNNTKCNRQNCINGPCGLSKIVTLVR